MRRGGKCVVQFPLARGLFRSPWPRYCLLTFHEGQSIRSDLRGVVVYSPVKGDDAMPGLWSIDPTPSWATPPCWHCPLDGRIVSMPFWSEAICQRVYADERSGPRRVFGAVPPAAQPRQPRRLSRTVKIFELAFPLEVTLLPSPALRLVSPPLSSIETILIYKTHHQFGT
jgi:hypothetical protein